MNNKGNVFLGFMALSLITISTISILEVKELLVQVDKHTAGKTIEAEENLTKISQVIKSYLSDYGACRIALEGQPIEGQIDLNSVFGDYRLIFANNLPVVDQNYLAINDIIATTPEVYRIKDIRVELPRYVNATFGPFNFLRRRLVIEVAKGSDMTQTVMKEDILLTIVSNSLTEIINCSVTGTKEDLCYTVGGSEFHCSRFPINIDKKITVLAATAGCYTMFSIYEAQPPPSGGYYSGLTCNSIDSCCNPNVVGSYTRQAYLNFAWR